MAKDPPSDEEASDEEAPTSDEGDTESEGSQTGPGDAAPPDTEVSDTAGSDTEGSDSEGSGTEGFDSEGSYTEPEEPADKRSKGKREFRWLALRRSADDRLIAGVSGGLGDYFGIDPVIVRIGFIVLTFFGGVGPVLYLVSWLIVPLDDSGSILANALRSGAPRRFRNLAGIGLIAFGLFVTAILSRNFFEVIEKISSTAPYLALALIVAGVGLIFWPRRSAPPLDTPAEPLAAPTTATVPSPPSAAGSEWPGANMGGEPEETKASWRDRRAERRSQRRGQSTVTFLTLAALLILTGGAILLDRLDMERVLLGEFFAVALLVVAAGLLVSVFVGRNWALIVLGVLLLGPLVVFSGSDTSWWSGFGDVKTVPEDISALDRDVKHGIGNLVVDLRSLDLDSLRSTERTSIDHNVRLTVGEVTIRVPADLRVRTNASIGAGNMRGGEIVTIRRVMVPRIEDGELHCVSTGNSYRVDEEIPDVRSERALCEASWWGHDMDVVELNRFEKGLSLEAEHNTHGEYDLEVNVEVGVGQVRVVRYPTHQR